MLANFDIFKTDQKGVLLWCAASETLEEAKSIVKNLADSRGEFVIFNQQTQESTNIRSEKQGGSVSDEKETTRRRLDTGIRIQHYG